MCSVSESGVVAYLAMCRLDLQVDGGKLDRLSSRLAQAGVLAHCGMEDGSLLARG